MSDPRTDELERLLDDLQRESEARRAELREIAAQLPAVVSRRALLRATARDVVRAPLTLVRRARRTGG